MSSAGTRIYLDECVDTALVQALQPQGFFVTTVQAEGMRGKSDRDQLDYAAGKGLILVTHNGYHFWRLHQEARREGRSHRGIIDLPEPRNLASSRRLTQMVVRIAMLLDWVDDWRDRFVRWGHLQTLIERGYHPSGFSEDEIRLALGRR